MQFSEPVSPFVKRLLSVDDNTLHVCLPAGLGDVTWWWSKWWKVAQERKIYAWLPQSEQHRAGPFLQMHGVSYGYLPNWSTNECWALPDDPEIPDTAGLVSTAVISCQPNVHLNSGNRIETWYPDIPFKNPAPESKALIYNNLVGDAPYVLVFMCHEGYMEGNLMPGQWTRMLRFIEKNIAPVVLIGMGEDVHFVRKICDIFNPTKPPALETPLDTLCSLIKDATLFVGIASGPSIISTYLGCPTLHFYPRHLGRMPHSWPHLEARYEWSYLDEAEINLADRLSKLLDTSTLGTRGRDLASSDIETPTQTVSNGVSGNGMAPDLSRLPVDTSASTVKGLQIQ